MEKRKQTKLDDAMGYTLEKSFRKAVAKSKKHGYVSIMDRPANRLIILSGSAPFSVGSRMHTAGKALPSRSEQKKITKKSA